MEKYDAIIIGAGSAGLGCLGMAKELGWRSVIIDKSEENIGGDCLNFGCVPSKALIHVAKYFYGAKQATRFGLKTSGKANWSEVIQYVHDKQAIIRAHESADYLRQNGENLVIGAATFKDKHTIEVNGQLYKGDKIFICTGSHPRHIPFEGIDKVNWFSNETLFYDMKTLPEEFIIIGGGPIGCEMAQVFQRLGSSVSIIDRGDRLLGKERAEASAILQGQFEREGIQMYFNHDVVKFENGTAVVIKNRATEATQTLSLDACLLAVGRGMNHASLDVAAAGLEETERGKLVINDYLQTSESHIYAVGDAAGMYQFSHGAEKHVNLLKHNFNKILDKKHHAKGLSWVTFTEPEIATFGFSEQYLQENKIDYWRQDQVFDRDDKAITAEYDYGKITLFVSKEKNKLKRKILGGTIVSPNAGEIMQELHLATTADLCLADFMDKVYAYPTASRINQQTIKGIINYKEE